MAEVARLIGGAGTGKTTELLRLLAEVVSRGVDPHEIGYISFTRAARREGAARAAEIFGCRIDSLEREGWYRTLHSACYRILGSPGDILASGEETRQWLRETLQEDISGAVDGEAGHERESTRRTEADYALAIWSAARNRLVHLAEEWAEVQRRDPACPSLGYCQRIVDRYERAKRIEFGRRDYTDLLAGVAGVRFTPSGAWGLAEPLGQIPSIPVWFFDEQQDTSQLLDAVCRRLIVESGARWAYIAGDPFQAIYSFSGADPSYFRSWRVDRERVMPRSYRCAGEILRLGERVLSQCNDYFDRSIAPADHRGVIESASSIAEVANRVDPRESWLLIARTNAQAMRFRSAMTALGKPWVPTVGLGGWAAPKKTAAIRAIISLSEGEAISPVAWVGVLKHIPANAGGTKLLERGTKTRWKGELSYDDARTAICLQNIEAVGGTENLRQFVAGGSWTSCIPGAREFCAARSVYGDPVVNDPRVQIGTIHSAKGAEAENVAFLDCVSRPIAYAMQSSRRALDEERRIKYVAITRAKRRLVIVQDRKAAKHPWRTG